MSSVDSVSSYVIGGYSSTASNDSELSEETIRKLEKYGIDVTSVSSESEAKKLIKEAEEAEESQTTKQQDDFYERVKNLAEKIGINVSQNENLESIFSNISSKIEDLKGDGYSSDYNVIKSEYEMLKLQYDNLSSGGSSTLNALDLLGQTNKIGIGL